MRFLLFLVPVLTFFSCKTEFSMLREDLATTDGVRVQILEKGTTNVIENYEVMAKDTEELELLRNAITRKNTPETKCSPTGKIIFYKEGKVYLYTDFQLEEGCNNISFIYRNRLYYKKLSKESLVWLTKRVEVP